jgi:predicted transcriptional regulator
MEVSLRPETGSRIQALASETGRPAEDLVEDAIAGYLRELAETRKMLDSRYDDFESGRVKAIDGESAFTQLRRKSQKRRSR